MLKILSIPALLKGGSTLWKEWFIRWMVPSWKGLDGQVMKAPIQDRGAAKISETHHARNGSEITLEDHYYCQY